MISPFKKSHPQAPPKMHPFKLAIYTNEYDFVIARSQEDAVKICMETMGYGEDDLEALEWVVMHPAKHFKYWEEIWHVIVETKFPFSSTYTRGSITRDRPSQWFVDVYGEGYFACTEF